jgi:hypothetical protein
LLSSPDTQNSLQPFIEGLAETSQKIEGILQITPREVKGKSRIGALPGSLDIDGIGP